MTIPVALLEGEGEEVVGSGRPLLRVGDFNLGGTRFPPPPPCFPGSEVGRLSSLEKRRRKQAVKKLGLKTSPVSVNLAKKRRKEASSFFSFGGGNSFVFWGCLTASSEPCSYSHSVNWDGGQIYAARGYT